MFHEFRHVYNTSGATSGNKWGATGTVDGCQILFCGAQSLAMASGKANVMDVVTAVAETDVAVSTLVSVRDRVIQAYEDIMRMPI